MKRSLAFIMFIFVLLIFASCSVRINIPAIQTKGPGISAPLYSPPVVVTGSPGLYTPPAIYTGPPVLSPVPFSGPAIISANGDVLGGYADGHWLTHSNAAPYCKGPVTFYKYNLAGLVDTVESSDVLGNDDAGFASSRTCDMAEGEYDEGFSCTLTMPEQAHGNYASDPLSRTYLATLPPERLPALSVISDTSPYLPAVQQLIDHEFGAGVAEAQIRAAVSADIDGDGQQEVLINADNFAHMTDYTGNLYSIVIVVENNGSSVTVKDFYQEDTGTIYPEALLYYAMNIIDIDGDGIYEIVVYVEGFEGWWVKVMKYDGHSVSEMLSYGYGL